VNFDMKLAEISTVDSTFPDKINKNVYMFHNTYMVNLLSKQIYKNGQSKTAIPSC
jgi:hypothetical protein